MSDTSTSKLLSHGSIYLVGNILRRMVSIVMLPIYTRFLTPAHYGTLELLSMIIDVVAIMVGLRIGQAVFRYYYEYDDERNRAEVMFTALALVFVLNAVGVVALLIGARPLAEAVIGRPDAAHLLALFSFTLVLQSLTETTLTFLRAEQRPWLFVAFSTAKLALQLGLNIYFVVVLRMAVEGVIISSLVAGVVIAIPMVWYTLSRTGIAFSAEKARAMAAFSLPLVLTGLISFYMTFGDRYFLRLLGGGLSEVGIYALGYRFGFLLAFLIGDPFFGIWDSEKYLTARRSDARHRFGRAFLVLAVGCVWVGVGLSVYTRDVLRIMADPSFWPAHFVVPVIILAYVLQIWTRYSNFGILLRARTREITTGTMISALVVTAAYLLLIPRFGGMGAAFATVIAFAARLAWITWRAERLYALHLPWGRAFAMLGLGAATWGLSLLTPESVLWSIAATTVLFGAFTAVLLLGPGFVPADLRAALLRAVRDRRLPIGRLRRQRKVDATTAARAP